MSTEGHFCNDCWCEHEHSCVCGMCDMTDEEIEEMMRQYDEILEHEA